MASNEVLKVKAMRIRVGRYYGLFIEKGPHTVFMQSVRLIYF